MTENDWFFDQLGESVYDIVKSGRTVLWASLSEQGRYEVWSLHMEAGGAPLTYSAFCDILDASSFTAARVDHLGIRVR